MRHRKAGGEYALQIYKTPSNQRLGHQTKIGDKIGNHFTWNHEFLLFIMRLLTHEIGSVVEASFREFAKEGFIDLIRSNRLKTQL